MPGGNSITVFSNDLGCSAPQPTAHRVINADPSRSRVSLPFFYEPAFEAVVAPLPQLAGALPGFGPGSGAGGLTPVRYGSHLESKVLSNFELEPDVAAVV
jgi:hypothetical protein